MPEDSKKIHKKHAKEQRKPRQRQQVIDQTPVQAEGSNSADKVTSSPFSTTATPCHKKHTKEQRKLRQRQQVIDQTPVQAEGSNSADKVTVPQKPPVYESPPPEFYKNLKRETEEVLKITEEENAKYKKKEIQSNWSKYEVPIESYDEIDEQENLGADYEKLIEAPLSTGGHFQFKHEKSWEINSGPSQYDKYFEINMEDLNLALCTIPFYERNDIKQTEFHKSDILSMNDRSTRFKQNYFNDKSYSTPETEVHDKILSSLRDTKNNTIQNFIEFSPLPEDILVSNDLELPIKHTVAFEETEFDDIFDDDDSTKNKNNEALKQKVEKCEAPRVGLRLEPQFNPKETPLVEPTIAAIGTITNTVEQNIAAAVETKVTQATPTVSEVPIDTQKYPFTETQEELEQWLEDFLCIKK